MVVDGSHKGQVKLIIVAVGVKFIIENIFLVTKKKWCELTADRLDDCLLNQYGLSKVAFRQIVFILLQFLGYYHTICSRIQPP